MNNRRYTYSEPIIQRDELRFLSLEKSDKALLKIFRLLSGTAKLFDEFERKKYVFRRNYFDFPFTENQRFTQASIVNNFPEDIKLVNLAEMFKKAGNNIEFYEAIEPEIVNCLIARNKERYLESFLFIYRILEGISYSIPLIYTSKAKNFTKSFKALQRYMPKKNNEGELTFFKKFITEVYKDEDFFSATVDIKMDAIDVEELKSTYYQLYKSKIDEKQLHEEVEDEELQVQFVGFYEFMIEIRNRYFHFLQGTWHDNIGSKQIKHPDLFFKPIVDLGINWVAIIFFEVIKFDFSKN